MPKLEKKKPDAPSLPLPKAKRLQLRDAFFRGQIKPRQWLEAFEQIPDVRSFLKDVERRLMALGGKRLAHFGKTWVRP